MALCVHFVVVMQLCLTVFSVLLSIYLFCNTTRNEFTTHCTHSVTLVNSMKLSVVNVCTFTCNFLHVYLSHYDDIIWVFFGNYGRFGGTHPALLGRIVQVLF